jgi:replicative DNA helicase
LIELILIKHLLAINNYNKYRHFIRIKEKKELEELYKILDSMMGSYGRDLTFSEFKATALHTNKELEFLLDRIEEQDIGEDVLEELVRSLVERNWAHDHAILSIEVSEGKKPLQNLLDHYSQVEDKVKVEEVSFVTQDLEELYHETVSTPGLRWRLNSLNRSLGSLRKGDFGFLFARPETGKTTFLASEITHFAGQIPEGGGPILWFNNEEQGNKVQIRIYQAALGCDLAKLYADRQRSQAYFQRATRGNIRIFDSSAIHRKQVERLCKELQPSLVLFDQIDKIKGFDNDREDLRLGSIYIWARELAKSYCPVIGVCQADVSGEGKKWLTMDNVANAKTSKQAEADWILGIGTVHELGLEHVRYLHISKNKLAGDEDSDPSMRHGKIEVIIDPTIARYKEYT